MRIVRDYFGADRTTVAYEIEISGVGGNADEFFVVAEVEKNGLPAVRTTVHFTTRRWRISSPTIDRANRSR